MRYLIAAFLLLHVSQQALAQDERFRCRAAGAGGREAELRFEPAEPYFRAKWEINLNQGQVPGTIVRVAIAGVFIGGITLELAADGQQLEGDFEFLNEDDFPENFPAIRAGTRAQVGGLTCSFRQE